MSKLEGEGAGKGDTPRPVKKFKFDASFERIFGKGRDPLDFHKGKRIKIQSQKKLKD